MVQKRHFVAKKINVTGFVKNKKRERVFNTKISSNNIKKQVDNFHQQDYIIDYQPRGIPLS